MTDITIEDVFEAFRSVTLPVGRFGDVFGIDATHDEVEKLLKSDQRELTAENFVNVLGYCTNPALLKFFLPALLRIWSSELSKSQSGFTQHFHKDMSRYDVVSQHLSSIQAAVVKGYARRAILNRLENENTLAHSGITSAHRWIGIVASYGVWTDDIEQLWSEWWNFKENGLAIAAVEYISCLSCEDSANPVFGQWTSSNGGGPPLLWEYDSIGFGECWKSSNIEFIRSKMSFTYLSEKSEACLKRMSRTSDRAIARRIRSTLDVHADRVVRRCTRLFEALGIRSGVGPIGWGTE